ncbi:site-specific tyrosine recombinase XerC [Thalassovita gelatinovora]|uniref:Site-specific tyrosine recombinase XerC n=1 Tax=Thalassovita gelatinovora TaxID=53501 RepID=A0A0P1F5G2_THAGE|nr:integrase arm-type DNA-binding domain-containing protein [Thalassovita gelatinovora]QIZ79594.1 site-specific integrase [Thalassovita gelatinovora]CUH63094.1 site-specific tyrosine recombinase XerC [Thalassovita gelatinovora]SEQ15683.1 Site-specific recombinase XerD [Thalassovita gelatinovora]
MTIFKFTEARIRDLPLGSGIHRDTDVKGLMCICHKTCKTFVVQSDVRREKRHVRTVRVKIGRADHIRLNVARNEARKLMATIQSGVDPTAGPESTGITLEQALKEHLKERELSDATVRNYQYHMDNYLGRLRRRAVADITRQDCRGLMDQLTKRHGKTTGGSVMRTVRALVNTARRHDETIGANPVDALRVPATPKREVGELDMTDFWSTTEAMSPLMRDLQRTFLLTGARRTSLLGVKCADFDAEAGVLTFTHMKTGGAWSFPTGRWLTETLKARMAEDAPLNSPWLWPSPGSATGHVAEPKRAGVPSPHSLRHHARTMMIAAGVPYAEGALLLGQRLPGASGGYVHQTHLVEALRPHAQALEDMALVKAGVA